MSSKIWRGVTSVGLGAGVAVIAACGGGGGSNGSVCDAYAGAGSPDVVVSAATGDDVKGTGSCAAPFKTITKGLSMATASQVVWVAPGTYNAALGETFPLQVPAGVTLLGDQAHKGNGATPTRILGGGSVPVAAMDAALYPLAGSKVAGFLVTDDITASPSAGFYVCDDAVAIRNNTLIDNALYGIYADTSGASNGIIDGNHITGSVNAGVMFDHGAGAGTVVQHNRVEHNALAGIVVNTPNADIGGGAAGSAGHNVFSCNGSFGLSLSSGHTYAENNQWDHVAPTTTTNFLGVADIYLNSKATVSTTNATLAPSPCP